MRSGTPGFEGARLREAREARGLTGTSLADLLGVSPQAISQYEGNHASPHPEVFFRLAAQLNLPAAFFTQPPDDEPEGTTFFRARTATTKTEQTMARHRMRWLRRIATQINRYVEFPSVSFPPVSECEWADLSDTRIEAAAHQARSYWHVGDGPVGNVVWLLENNGAVASRGVLASNSIDAFSALRPGEPPWVFLGADKSSAARSRFDAAHELGHILLHRQTSEATLADARSRKQIETQADKFASAFLLPSEGFAADFYRPTLDALRIIKSKWGVSIAAMIMRARDLSIISEDTARRLFIARARRGWSRQEPLDEIVPAEEPLLLRKSFALIFDEAVASPAQVMAELPYSAQDIESRGPTERMARAGGPSEHRTAISPVRLT